MEKMTRREKAALKYFKTKSNDEIYIDMAMGCLDKQENIIEEAFSEGGGFYLSDGMWIYPDGSIREW